ncbi:hypothetical protein G647_00614 [Cladophialophora carrionii CBS 160.54]|uniref:Transcription factor Iwr1 domain-containing protein n=1 Tax=Cladophialophora carrionii CBS 160.54 TaxID=1279043 RepID=V9DMR6_9EURO|nr:uncharacterized protein G647_00614 [Cladophialophora carrionii CBS 160.54]ETI28165.1 hypothetical protein G647_00614 [Cladophialophora carrionii CBS 160.54]
MSLPPERISVKRRRQEEPVETLYLERGDGTEKKRRVTDYYFQRVRNDTIAPISQRDTTTSQTVWSKPPAPGVPPIRLTTLEGQKEDASTPKAAVKAKANSGDEENHKIPGTPSAPASSKSAPTTPAGSQPAHQARRFHLARHLSSVLSPHTSGGIRKSKHFIRPPLATFIERHGAVFDHEQNPLYRGQPVDKMLEVPKEENSRRTIPGEGEEPTLDTLSAFTRSPTSTFVQARPKTIRNGTSIRDHPSTWDLESDQLADELAALAMEFDPELKDKVEVEASKERPVSPPPAPRDVAMTTHSQEDGYIYETYIRVPYDGDAGDTTNLQTDYGILVIDEEDEDLWQKYVDSEDETDWDEEDSNAEDNPANDYPEDEVSSDDEFSYNAYKYRAYGSDQEELDDKYD